MDKTTAEKVKARYVAPIHEYELACRIMEAMMRPPQARPAGFTAAQALSVTDPEMREMALDAARAAMNYWRECITAANSTN